MQRTYLSEETENDWWSNDTRLKISHFVSRVREYTFDQSSGIYRISKKLSPEKNITFWFGTPKVFVSKKQVSPYIQNINRIFSYSKHSLSHSRTSNWNRACLALIPIAVRLDPKATPPCLSTTSSENYPSTSTEWQTMITARTCAAPLRWPGERQGKQRLW